ncbi:MAG: 2-oxoglutarate dehydrogenase complex dihydrolipoyllysine-residue succinyltransferase [Alphaproteobacteria bacterium]|nr:2-oxoglutarate dehydrogenase complex dihydrolipoyllysine-residue succinyltransferase [Alphaproteobacteria bacterium]
MVEIVVPVLGESVSEATVAQWLKKEGETVKTDEPIVELETDKVTLEIPAPSDGIITKIIVNEGENVEIGAILGELSENANTDDMADSKKTTTSPVKTEATSRNTPKTSPDVPEMINNNNLDSPQIPASEEHLSKENVQKFIADQKEKQNTSKTITNTKSVQITAPSKDRKIDTREERIKMTKLRRIIASRLKEAQNTAAMLTTFNEVDMSAVMNIRKTYQEQFIKKNGVKLGFMSFFVKATIQALKEFPSVNAEIDGEDIIYKNYYNIGVAVSTPQGLVVPVIRDADQMNMAEIESSIVDLGTRARDGKLSIDEIVDGTFTITNGGIFGSMMSTPILNTPQSGILGMHNIVQRPMVMKDGSIEARPMMYLALTYDHRIVDGREAVSTVVRIKEALEDPQRIVIEV